MDHTHCRLSHWQKHNMSMSAVTGVALDQGIAMLNTGAQFVDESYGRAAARAYAAYGNPTFLDYAIQCWWFGRGYPISTPDEILSQSHKFAKTVLTCEGPRQVNDMISAVTMAGDTSWETDVDEPHVVALGTGSLLVLSALLAEATVTSDAVLHLRARKRLVRRQLARAAIQYNSGLMIQGLGILADITPDATVSPPTMGAFMHLSEMRKRFSDILLATISNTASQQPDGIVGDFELVQGLGVVCARKFTTAALRSYVAAYLSVQVTRFTSLK
ncbi:hypothetical protein B0H11DRAFT_2345634 [Mycena galericulata]|nr:hypothetical protein B0H11DRAFT_2345634 [Mycena galericulata]